MSFSYTLYIWYEIQLSWNVIQILICSTWNVVKISLTHPHRSIIPIYIRYGFLFMVVGGYEF